MLYPVLNLFQIEKTGKQNTDNMAGVDHPYTPKIGDRVEILEKGCAGTVAFIGGLKMGGRTMMGVVLDQPVGLNNGMYKGRKHFSCKNNHGLFVLPDKVILLESAMRQKQLQMRQKMDHMQEELDRLKAVADARGIVDRTAGTSQQHVRQPHQHQQQQQQQAAPPKRKRELGAEEAKRNEKK